MNQETLEVLVDEKVNIKNTSIDDLAMIDALPVVNIQAVLNHTANRIVYNKPQGKSFAVRCDCCEFGEKTFHPMFGDVVYWDISYHENTIIPLLQKPINDIYRVINGV